MSQHILETINSQGKPVIVTMGYDRPLDYVFCTVLGKDGDLIYSNLGDEMAGTELQDVEYYRSILKRLRIHVPEIMFDEVNSDQMLRVGNRVMHHAADKKTNWIQRLLHAWLPR